MNIEKSNKEKYKKLVIGVVLDVIGMLSFSLPFIGEFGDVIWAPISAFLLTKMYKGNTGKIAGIIGFIEELLPGLDVIPTFTLTWIYQYILKSKILKDDVIDLH